MKRREEGISCQDKSVVASQIATNDLCWQCNPSVTGRASNSGITLVALVVTIVVLLILAGITIMYVMGDNGVFGQASQAKVQTELGKIEERAQTIYSDKLMESTSSSLNTKVETSEVISQLESEGYNIEKRKTGEGGITGISLDKESMTIALGKTEEIHITYERSEDDFAYYAEVQGKYYEMKSNKGFITIDREASNLTKTDFENENGEEGVTLNLTVTSSKTEVATARVKEKTDDTIIEVTALKLEGDTEITVTYGSFEPLKCTVTVADIEIEESKAFSRANGVIDIVWLNTDNTVRTENEGPLSPKDSLGNLTAIKYNGSQWVEADTTNTENSWYNYEAQTGNTENGGTSNWANAVANFEGADTEKAYFVWIPRYAYKITYFDTPDNANAYRANRNSKTGIIGYSNIKGMVDVKTEKEKLVKGSEPNNVTGTVKTPEYADYIPHPAFEFDGSKAGIWVGKFESSSETPDAPNGGGDVTNLKVRIVPNVTSWRTISVSNIFTVCQEVKKTYSLTGDSHMMKNTEWGAVAYLAESKYGRNGTEIGMSSTNYTTGQGDYETNTNLSTTGNIYGIYDMNGGSWEYVAGYINNSEVVSNNYNTDLINAVKTNPEYANVYTITTDNQSTNYSNSKGIKGDAVFETTTTGSNSTSWHSDYSYFPNTRYPVFVRGRLLR